MVQFFALSRRSSVLQLIASLRMHIRVSAQSLLADTLMRPGCKSTEPRQYMYAQLSSSNLFALSSKNIKIASKGPRSDLRELTPQSSLTLSGFGTVTHPQVEKLLTRTNYLSSTNGRGS
jgi:hypothetical protein